MPFERSASSATAARIAALTRWSRQTDDERRAATQAARDGLLARFEREADPDGRMTPRERREAALRLRRAHMTRLAAKATAARAAKRKGKTFVLAWLDAVAASDVPTNAKAVALAMATHAHYGTGANMRASRATLGTEAGLSERATIRAIGALRDAGLIEWDGTPTAPGRTRVYALTVAPATHHANCREPFDAPGQRTATSPRPASMPTTVLPETH